jgi:transcriptional regulator with XRE-family HTH domain
MNMKKRDKVAFYRAAGSRLRTVRFLFKLTEAEAAAAADVTVRTWRGWEAGKRHKSMEPILRFAKIYNVSLDWLFVGGGAWLYTDLMADPPEVSIIRKLPLAS